MHNDNKLANHGKQVGGDGRAPGPGVNPQVLQQQQQQQGAAAAAAAAHLGSKAIGAGSHGVKSNQISLAGPGMKAAGQAVGGVGGMLKTKSKRERSVSMDSGESRNAIPAAVLEADVKGEGVMRSKRRCVLEKKQPYSGDEWCSGPDTEEDEDKPHTAAHRDRGLAGPMQVLPDRLSAGPLSESGGPVMGCGVTPGLKTEPAPPSQQVVYVFTTNLANSAAEAVMKGQSDSILLFHQQNVPTSKLEQGHSSGKLSKLCEKVTSSCSPPKSQSGTPRPGSAGVGPLHPAGTPSSATHSDTETSQTRPGGASSNNSLAPHRSDGGRAATPAGPTPAGGDGDGAGAPPLPVAAISPSGSPSMLSAHLQSEAAQRCGPGSTDGLSKEQLEHRERSLQTLRDIERLLLRSGAGGGPAEAGGPNSNAPNNPSNLNNNGSDRSGVLEDADNGTGTSGNCGNANMLAAGLGPMGGLKKYEEPLQSMISQTQSLGGPPLDGPQMDSHHSLPQHHPLSSPGDDMGPLLGPEGLTPEQMAWRKLQEDYYQEKRRQQEVQPSSHPQHFRMMSEMGMHGGPPMMMRGPPPPYHSKPGGPQWGPAGMMAGGIAGGERMMDMHQEGPRGPRFLGQIQRGQSVGGGFPSSPGGVLSMEGLGPQRPSRPGMIWLDDMPNNIGGGGPFHGCYGGGPNQHAQGEPEHLLTREEIFRIMEKRHMQGVSRFELDRLAKQQQQQQGTLGSRIMDNLAGPDFPGLGMGRGPPASRGEPMEFPVSREMMGSPVGGPQMRELVDSSMGNSLGLNMSVQQQQQMILAQKLRGGQGGPLAEMFGSGEISRIRTSQNGRGGSKGMVPGPDGPFQFPNQGPFPGGQVEGAYLQQPGPEMFGSDQQGPNQMGGTPRLSHMPMAGGLRGAELGPRHPSDLSVNAMTSPSVPPPPHQLKSPSLNQEPSPLLPSPSAPGLKSPSQISAAGHHAPPPPASGAATPSSMKSPQILGSSSLGLHSPSASPGRLKSPAMGSPGWTSPKTALPSPGGPPGGKAVGNGGGSSTETGPSIPPRSSNSTPISQPGSMNPAMPFTSSPDAPPSQNPLSLIMSQMSKYAMPSSTPLYHDAIKTIATSDDEMLPDRPLLSAVSIGGNMVNPQTSQILVSQGPMGPHSDPQSPMGIVGQGPQHLSHDASGSVLSSPNPMGMPAMNSAMMGGDGPEGMGPCNVSPQGPMGGFPRMQPPSHGAMHSPLGMSQSFSQSSEDLLAHQQLHLMSKGHPHQRAPHPSDSFASLPMGEGPDLSEVIRPTHTGIPEFDLSRIIPSDKPSSTLQYFPKSEPHPGPPPQHHTPQQLLKQLSASGPPHGGGGPASNPHLASLQNMMAEQQLPPHAAHAGIRQGLGGSRGMVPGGAMGPMCPPAHMMGRTGLVQQQQQLQQQQQQAAAAAAMMNSGLLHHPSTPYPAMMPSQQHPHNLMAQQNLMMMQAKQRSLSLQGEPFGPQGPLMSPQGPMMGPSHPQPGMMGPQSLRQRGMSLDSPVGYGPGGMPF